MNSESQIVRTVRIMKIGFITFALLLIYLIFKIPASAPQPIDPTVEMAVTILALVDVVLGFVFPRFMMRMAQRAPGNAAPATALQRWFAGSVVGLAFLESCNLFGFALHFLGAELGRSELLIGVGIVATMFFSAGAPPGRDEGNRSQG